MTVADQTTMWTMNVQATDKLIISNLRAMTVLTFGIGRSKTRKRCEMCGKRRVVYTALIHRTGDEAVGGPWLCRECALL